MSEKPHSLTPRRESEEGYYTELSTKTTSLQTPPGVDHVDARDTPNDNQAQPMGKQTQCNFCANKDPFMKIGIILIVLLLVVNVILIILNITGTINKDQSTDESQLKGLRYENATFKLEQEMLSERIDEMQRKEIELKDEMKTLNSRIASVEEKSLAGEVAFLVHLSDGDRSITAGSILIFDVIVTNHGDGYSADSGAFTAPLHGLYAFNLFFQTFSDTQSRLGIFVNSGRVCSGFGVGGFNQGTCTALVELQAGDVVNVKAIRGVTLYGRDPGGDINGLVGYLYLPL